MSVVFSTGSRIWKAMIEVEMRTVETCQKKKRKKR